MISKVRIKLTDEQMDIVCSFARQVGLNVEDFCKQAVFYAINHATLRAEAAQAAEVDAKEMSVLQEFTEETNGSHNTESGDTEGTTAKDEVHTPSDALSNQETVTDKQD